MRKSLSLLAFLALFAACTAEPNPDAQATVDAAVAEALLTQPTATPDIQATVDVAVAEALAVQPTAVPTWTPQPTWTPETPQPTWTHFDRPRPVATPITKPSAIPSPTLSTAIPNTTPSVRPMPMLRLALLRLSFIAVG